MINSQRSDYFEFKLVSFRHAQFLPGGGQLLHESTRQVDEYSAPEMILGQGYDEIADVWSATVIIYLLLSMELPFQAANPNALIGQISANEVRLDTSPWVPVSDIGK